LSAAQESAELSLLASGDSCECFDSRWSCVSLEDGQCSGSGWDSGELENTPERCLIELGAQYNMGYCNAGSIVTDVSELTLAAGDSCSCLDTRWGCVDLATGDCSGTGWDSGELENTPEFCF
jgi:hypothetical protein